MNKNLKRGFTLIELLVVIAIIGILAAVVIASLNSARSKGADASVKANLSNMRAQAELIYDEDSSYANVCTKALNMFTAGHTAGASTAAAVTALATAQTGTLSVCHSDASGWVASVRLNTESRFFCVDSSGVAKTVTGLVGASGVTCPAS